MRRRRDQDHQGEKHFGANEPSKRKKTDFGGNYHRQPRQLTNWKVPESHSNMPHVIRQEVREFH